jgi:hypothetical protein
VVVDECYEAERVFVGWELLGTSNTVWLVMNAISG